MNNQSSSTGVVIGVLIVLAVLVIGFLAYRQGYFQGTAENNTNGSLQINLSGGSDSGENQ